MHRSGGGRVFSKSRRPPPPGDGKRYPTQIVLMLSLLLCLIASVPPTSIGQPIAEAAADEAGLSHLLALTLEYDDSPDPRFVAILKNRSSTDLNIVARFAELHGTFHIVANGGTETELYLPRYRLLLLTSTWFDPTNKMPADAVHRWDVRLSELVDLHGRPMPRRQILGSKVFLTISRVAIIPSGLQSSFVSNNAMQRSTPIRIPDGG
ncbi:hypothetical protein Poly51_49390 [Rubripirellula tenax]|uniref:Uncharacterized protein n=1 Tax=Rubripirellula tenax TaxID=2528015 RepID=A0A5C6EKL1_9BACT|nr:hypothetical protein Poly51_49390 [Rubripirellula tenax]